MTPPLDIAELRRLADDGAVDTVIVCFPDMQGRPVGKRVTAPFFFADVLEHGIDACDYLLAVDVDVQPLPGYRFASWESGYGDVRAVPDLDTLRLVPWLDRSAHVICDLSDSQGADVEVSPRRVLRRQIERAAAAGLEVKCATELEFFLFRDSYEEAAAKRLARARTELRHDRGLPAPSDLARRERPRPRPQRDDRRRHPDRALEG